MNTRTTVILATLACLGVTNSASADLTDTNAGSAASSLSTDGRDSVDRLEIEPAEEPVPEEEFFCGGDETTSLDIATSHFWEGDNREARRLAKRALRQASDDWERASALSLLGEIALAEGHPAQAKRSFMRAARLNDEVAQTALVGLATAHYQLGELEEARVVSGSFIAEHCTDDYEVTTPCYAAFHIRALSAETSEQMFDALHQETLMMAAYSSERYVTDSFIEVAAKIEGRSR